MIAHNEADTIGAALSSVTWADQIVVVDTDSTDETADIARKMGAEVHVEPNHPNLNINKNIAINLCRGDWIFVLDADERIPYELAGEIRLAINEGRADGYLVPRRNWVLGKWMKRGGEYPDYQLRLFRRGRGGFPAVHIHERLTVEGKVKRLSRPFDHYPYPDLNSMIGKNLRDTRFEAWHLFQNGKRIGTVGLGFRIFTVSYTHLTLPTN